LTPKLQLSQEKNYSRKSKKWAEPILPVYPLGGVPGPRLYFSQMPRKKLPIHCNYKFCAPMHMKGAGIFARELPGFFYIYITSPLRGLDPYQSTTFEKFFLLIRMRCAHLTASRPLRGSQLTIFIILFCRRGGISKNTPHHAKEPPCGALPHQGRNRGSSEGHTVEYRRQNKRYKIIY